MTKRVTIRELARLAGVSPTTVSMALNNRPRVGRETRRRILELAEQLNYQPSIMARGLRHQRTYTIALIVRDITDLFYPELASTVGNAARARGYQMILTNVGEDPAEKEQAIHLLRNQGVDGLISTVTLDGDAYLEELAAEGPPLVTAVRPLNKSRWAGKFDAVSIDNYEGGFKVGEHLCRLGHRHIAVLTGDLKASTAQARTQGVLTAMKTMGITNPGRFVVECAWSRDKAMEAARELLTSNPSPTAFFAQEDNMALGVREVILSSGLRIPQDVALVGFDNIQVSALTGIDLTTVDQKVHEIGITSLDLLLKKIESRDKTPVNQVVFEGNLIVRKSCGFELGGYLC